MRIFLVSSMVLAAGLIASLTTWLIQSTRARRQKLPHPVVSITVHHPMPDRIPSDLFLDEDDQFDYSFAQIKRLRFARWLVEQGHLSEF